MIKTEVLTASLPICDRLYKANRIVVTSENSPVAVLNIAAHHPVVDQHVGEVGFVEAWLEGLARMNPSAAPSPIAGNADGEDMSFISTDDYAVTMKEASSMLAQGARNALYHAKNVASPIIKSVFDYVEEHMSNTSSTTEEVEIVEFKLNDAWAHPTVLAALARNKVPMRTVQSSSVPMPENLEDYLKSGSGQVDQVYQQLLSDCGWTPEKAFQAIFDGGRHGAYAAPVYANINEVLIKFLTAAMMVDNPVPNSGLSASGWEALTCELESAYGALANELMTDLSADRSTGRLVFEFDRIKQRIVVDGSVYDSWLDQGGTPEILIGAYVNRAPSSHFMGSVLLENADALTSAWSTHHAMRQMKEESGRTARISEALLYAVQKEIAELDEEFYAPNANINTMLNTLRKKVGSLTGWHHDNLPATIVDVVCDVLFPHTKAKFFINRMTARKEQEVDQKTAEAMVIAEYITQWCLTGMALEKF